MPVAITWSLTPGGSPSVLVEHGTVSNGNIGAATNVYLRHNGVNPITSASFYFQQRATGYTGDFSGAADISELREWGDQDVADDFGGIQVNMDPLNSSVYDAGTWDLAHNNKTTDVAFVMHTGVADNADNAVSLKQEMSAGMSVDGILPAGQEARFLLRFQVPTNESDIGIRQVDQVLRYTYTS